MNIVYFTHEKAFGGASRSLLTIIDENKNNNIIVVTPFKKSKINEELKRRNIKTIHSFYSWWQIPANINVIKKNIYRILYFFNFISEIRLYNILKKMEIDIIHSNTSVIDIGAKLAKKLNVKHIWHFREFAGIHLNFIKSNEKSYNFINNNTDKIIYISKSIKEYYEKNINKELGVLIYNGIVMKDTKVKKYKKSKKINFLQVATIEEKKGQELAILAAKELIEKNIKNFKITFIGNAPNNYIDHINELINKCNLNKYIKYKGFNKNIKEERKNYDVELMLSYEEAFGLVTIEAMYAGNPVIGSNSGGTKELIIHNKNGLLFERKNAKSLALEMVKYINNPQLIEKNGKFAQEYVKKFFSSKRLSMEIMNIYNEVKFKN